MIRKHPELYVCLVQYEKLGCAPLSLCEIAQLHDFKKRVLNARTKRVPRYFRKFLNALVRCKIQLTKLMEDNRLSEFSGSAHSNLYERIISKENLFAAWREFQRGKTSKSDVLSFAERFEEDVLKLHYALVRGTYTHDDYSRFFIHDPKQRSIAKGSVRDRVLHHAICRILIPLFDKQFIFDSYSSRKTKGTHRATERFTKLAWRLSRNNTRVVWVLKCDVRKFFGSVDHAILLRLCGKKIKDARVLALLENILDSYQIQPGKGIPLGNLTSQLFANVYLNELDQYIKRTLRVKNYLRYTDDFVLLSRDRKELEDALPRIKEFVESKLNLELHPNKVLFLKWHSGIDFLGCVHFPYHRIVRTNTKKRIFRKLKRKHQELAQGEITSKTFEQSLQSYLGVLSHARSRGIARTIRTMFPAVPATDSTDRLNP